MIGKEYAQLVAPVYSRTLVDERGRPLLLGHAPVTYDRYAGSRTSDQMPHSCWRHVDTTGNCAICGWKV